MMRSDSRFFEEPTSMTLKVENEAVTAAQAKQTGFTRIDSLTGQDSFAAYNFVDIRHHLGRRRQDRL